MRPNRSLSLCNPYVPCSDAGCVLRPDWIENIVAPLETDSKVDIVSGFYALECHSLFQRCLGLATMPGQLDPPDPDRFLPSARSIAFRKTVWEAAGGYPEWLYTGEDTLFDLKLKKMGYTFYFARNALVDWEPRKGWREIAKQFYLYSRGGGQLGWAKDYLLWAAKRLLVFGTIVVAGLVYWPLWTMCFPVIAYDHLTSVHPIAIKVRNKCGSLRAYWLTSGMLWLIRNVRTLGYFCGSLQRLANPSKYVQLQARYMCVDKNDKPIQHAKESI